MTTNELATATKNLKSENPDIRIQTIKWLANQKSHKVVDLLLHSLEEDTDYNVANEAEIALHNISIVSKFKDYLLTILKDNTSINQKEIIARILQNQHDHIVAESLLAISEKYPENLRLRESTVWNLIFYDQNQARDLCRKVKIDILVAEDERDILDLVCFTLRYAGWSVIGADNGELAYDLAEICTPDLILLDVRMPKMTGYDACRAIKNNSDLRHIPVVFLSAKAQDSEIQIGLSAGAEEYILKPFFPDQLVERIKKVMRNRRLGVY